MAATHQQAHKDLQPAHNTVAGSPGNKIGLRMRHGLPGQVEGVGGWSGGGGMRRTRVQAEAAPPCSSIRVRSSRLLHVHAKLTASCSKAEWSPSARELTASSSGMRSCTKPPAELPQPAATALAVPTILRPGGAASQPSSKLLKEHSTRVHARLQPSAAPSAAIALPTRDGGRFSRLAHSRASRPRPTWA